MALNRGLRVGVDGKAKQVKAVYIGVDGKAKKVTKAYVGVNGKAVRIWPPIDTAAQVTGNKFTVIFDTLSDKNVTGVWNVPAKKIEF